MPAASILSSNVNSVSNQHDGRKRIEIRFVDNANVVRFSQIIVDVGVDPNSLVAAASARLAADLSSGEIDKNLSIITALGSAAGAQVTTVYCLIADVILAVRTAYQSSSGLTAIMFGDWLRSRTSAELQVAFSLNAGQTTTLLTSKLTPAQTTATQIRSATGQ
jgi:hypothetical protein